MENDEKKLLEIAEAGGNDADLILLERIEGVEEKVETVSTEVDEKLIKFKEDLPDLNKVLESVKGQAGEKGDIGEKPVAGIDYPIPKNGEDGRTPIHTGKLAPTNPQKGDLWYQD